MLLPTLPKKKRCRPRLSGEMPNLHRQREYAVKCSCGVSCPVVPFHPFSCSTTAPRRSTATVCVILLTLPVPGALQTVAVDVGLSQYRKSSIPSRTLPRKRARPKVSSKVKGNCRPQRWRPGLQITFGQYRSLFRSWILQQIVVTADIDRIEDVGLRYCVLDDRVGIAVAGSAKAVGINEHAHLSVTDRRHRGWCLPPGSLPRPPIWFSHFSIAGSNTGAEREVSQGRVLCAA